MGLMQMMPVMQTVSKKNEKLIIRLQKVARIYKVGVERIHALDGIDLELSENEYVAVMGASGSGKCTLLHLLGVLVRPDEVGGHVFFDCSSFSAMSRGRRNRYRNRSIGFVFQFYHLLPELNVLENTFLPALVGLTRLGYYAHRAEIRGRAAELLAAFGLDHRLAHRPRELSGGERQRVAIARALVNRPQVLLADEPTGNLDEKTGAEILDLLAEQHADGLTIVMVTHDRAIADRADRVVELHDGKVVG